MTNRSEAPDRVQRIKVSKNGPYLVSGSVPIAEQVIGTDSNGTSNEWRAGRKYALQERCALCRCGQSRNKPFCDGTHMTVGFDGTETASREPYLKQAKEINGPAMKLTDAEIFCASARFCDRAGGIWNHVPQSHQPESGRIVAEEAAACPSGRLVVWDPKTGKPNEPKLERSIGLVEDPQLGVMGPIWVRGGIPIESADGKIYEIRNRVTLCRCGRSSNKPFCDGSHCPEEQ